MSIEWTRADSLPDTDTDLIIATADGEVSAGYYDGHEWKWINLAEKILVRVTHWAPFPKPPEDTYEQV